MARARDPNRDKAFEIWKQAGGEIKLKEIADQLGVSEGTVRGWKAKDKWQLSGWQQLEPTVAEMNEEDDELYDQAVYIVVEAQAASASLLQRRLRIGYTRAAKLVEMMEQKGVVGPYEGSAPRKVFLKEAPIPTTKKSDIVPKPMERSNQSERNAPKNAERSKPEKVKVELTRQPEIENDQLTDKQRLFVMEYLRDFNATRAAIAAGYSKRTAHVIGWETLRNPKVQAEIQRQKDTMTTELGLDVQRIIAEYMKIAFTDITDLLEFGQREVPVMTMFGPLKDENGNPVTKIVNYVDFKESSQIDGAVISEVKQGKDGVSIKLHDKMRALKELEKYLGYMTEEQRLRVEKLKLEVGKLQSGEDDRPGEVVVRRWCT